MNYNEEMNKIVKELDYKPKLLLHSCCAPCSTTCIERLKDHFDITILYYNPNIEPYEEYEKRKQEQIRIIKHYNINYLDCDYDNNVFHEMSTGLEKVPERGVRCHKCYRLRLDYTAKLGKTNNFVLSPSVFVSTVASIPLDIVISYIEKASSPYLLKELSRGLDKSSSLT